MAPIMSRGVLRTAAVSALAAALALGHVGVPAAAVRPNVLLLMADQMRWDVVTPQFTPALTALAASGLTLRSTYATTPSCTPSRAALLTGLSPWYHGMLGYGDIAVQYPFEMPRALGG